MYHFLLEFLFPRLRAETLEPFFENAFSITVAQNIETMKTWKTKTPSVCTTLRLWFWILTIIKKMLIMDNWQNVVSTFIISCNKLTESQMFLNHYNIPKCSHLVSIFSNENCQPKNAKPESPGARRRRVIGGVLVRHLASSAGRDRFPDSCPFTSSQGAGTKRHQDPRQPQTRSYYRDPPPSLILELLKIPENLFCCIKCSLPGKLFSENFSWL